MITVSMQVNHTKAQVLLEASLLLNSSTDSLVFTSFGHHKLTNQTPTNLFWREKTTPVKQTKPSRNPKTRPNCLWPTSFVWVLANLSDGIPSDFQEPRDPVLGSVWKCLKVFEIQISFISSLAFRNTPNPTPHVRKAVSSKSLKSMRCVIAIGIFRSQHQSR